MTIKVPEPASTGSQIGAAVARSVLSAVPWVGGALVEVLEAVTSAGYERRRTSWMAQVTDALNERVLKPRDLDWTTLETNEGFLDVIGRATRAAVQTHDRAKIDALCNAVVNVAQQPDLDSDRTAILLGLVETLTGTHLRVLSTFADPKAAYKAADTPLPDVYAGARMTVVRDLLPELASDSWFAQKIEQDLKQAALTDLNLNSVMTGAGIFEPCILPLGSQLLTLISSARPPT